MIERRVGLAGPEPAPALGHMKAARGDAPRRRADEHHRSECRVRRARRLVARLRGVASCRGRASGSSDESPSTWRVGSSPLDFGEVARRAGSLRHTRRARRRRERIASGRASIGVGLALARWVTTTARRGSFPPSRRRSRGPETRQIRPRRRPLRAARTAPCSPVGPAAAGAPCPPTRPSALSGYGASPPRLGAPLIPPRTPPARISRDRSKRQRTAGGTTWRAGATSTSAAQTSANLRPCLFWRQGLCKNGDKCGYVHGDSLVHVPRKPPRVPLARAPSDTSPSPVRILPPREPQAPRFYPRRRTRSPHTPRTAGAGCVARPIP